MSGSDSALRGVFGSTASLAELSGDVEQSSRRPPSGYSRFGLSEHPPAHQMHSKVPRRQSLSGSEKPNLAPRVTARKVLVLLLFGVLQGYIMNAHLPRFRTGDVSHLQRALLIALSSILVVASALIIPATDKSLATRDQWTTGLIRGYGAILGLLYLTQQLSRDAVLAWALINPSMWYISDKTVNGFTTASVVTVAGTLATAAVAPQLWRGLPWDDVLFRLAGTATGLFGTALVAGNVGRGVAAW